MRVLTLLVATILIAGCGSSTPFSGQFQGNTALTMGPQQAEALILTTTQTESQVTGTFTSTLKTTGSLYATVTDSDYLTNIQFVVAPVQGYQVCAGTFTGTGMLQDYHLRMRLSGQTACGYQTMELDLVQTIQVD